MNFFTHLKKKIIKNPIFLKNLKKKKNKKGNYLSFF